VPLRPSHDRAHDRHQILQLAARRGVKVIGAASDSDRDRVEGWGAQFQSRDDGLGRRVRATQPDGVDAVLDAVATLPALRPGGTCPATLPQPLLPAETTAGLRVETIGVHADSTQLRNLVALVDSGELDLRVADVYPLADVSFEGFLSVPVVVTGRQAAWMPLHEIAIMRSRAKHCSR
jgi:NADPH:quinone reductase-like Zn-dependent oxidoreductase